MDININKLIELNNIKEEAEHALRISKNEFIDKLEPFTNMYTTLLREFYTDMAKKYLTDKVKWELTKAGNQSLSQKISALFDEGRWLDRFDTIDVSICKTVYIYFIEVDNYYREDNDEVVKQICINESFFDKKFIESEIKIISEEFEKKLKNIFLDFNDDKKRKLEEMKAEKEFLERKIKDLENDNNLTKS